MIFTMEFFNFNEHDDPAIESLEKMLFPELLFTTSRITNMIFSSIYIFKHKIWSFHFKILCLNVFVQWIIKSKS